MRRILDAEDLKDETQLERVVRDLERSVKRSRNKNLGIEEEEEDMEEASFPLLEVPDEELDEAGIKSEAAPTAHEIQCRSQATGQGGEGAGEGAS